MAPDTTNHADPNPPNGNEDAPLGALNWILFLCGFGFMLAGYVVLARAGREATDAWGRMAPYCIVGGLALFGAGFIPFTKGR